MNEQLYLYPRVTIITVCFNIAETIEQTIQSVINQTYKNIEYIIIDGGSTDGTIEIIKKYQNNLYYWVTEPDKGIYDAMNKGIDYANGDYIYFLGADDSLAEYETMTNVITQLYNDNSFDIICGNVYFVDEGPINIQRKIGIELTRDDVLSGTMYPHQGMIVKAALFKKYKFNLSYKIGADYDFFIKCLLDNVKIKYIDVVIAYFALGGHSFQYVNCLEEHMQILTNNNVGDINNGKFKRITHFNAYIVNALKKVLSSIGLIHITKLVAGGYMVHNCRMKKCRWCSQNKRILRGRFF